MAVLLNLAAQPPHGKIHNFSHLPKGTLSDLVIAPNFAENALSAQC